MEQLNKIFEVSNKLGASSVALTFDGKWHFQVNGKKVATENEYLSIVGKMKEHLYGQVDAMMSGNQPKADAKPQKEKVKVSVVMTEDEVMKTRKEWSVGNQGDPRKNQRRGRKGKKGFSKSQILTFMRKTHNGRFSSELITYAQYVKEFTREYKKAYNREWWRANLGKGSEHYDKNDYRAIVKK